MRAPWRYMALVGLCAAGGVEATPPIYYRSPSSSLPFSDAVRAGDFLILSGQIGSSPAAGTPEGFKAAAHQAMDRIAKVLAAHGSAMGHVVKCTVMLSDMKNWPVFNEVYSSYFDKDRLPARSAFAVAALAMNAPLEVECMAYEPPR